MTRPAVADAPAGKSAERPSGPSGVAPAVAAAAAGPVRGGATVALVGAPNSGKSTLFNALTGGERTVGNWPGSTVDIGREQWRPITDAGARTLTLLDLPGALSLDPVSPDERLTRDLLRGDGGDPADDGADGVGSLGRPDLAVVVADASRLARSLYLVAQLRESDQRVLVALTMADVAARQGTRARATALAERLGCPVVEVDPRHRTGLDQLASAVLAALDAPAPPPRTLGPVQADAALADRDELAADDDLAAADERFGWLAAALEGAVTASGTGRTRTDRVDRWATAPIIGAVAFLAVMWAVFEAATQAAAPLQRWLGDLVSGPVTAAGRRAFAAIGLAASPVRGFVVDGLIAGVGMLLTFVPLMALMFAALAALEDSGYLARAAVVTDRLMSRLGLPGKAFLPLVVGFGCNVPAISAVGALGDARQRRMTALLVPFTSCSARLTVYVLVAATFFPGSAGTVVFGMYLLSIALVVGVGLALRHSLWHAVGDEPLLLDLPAYQRPSPRVIGAVTWGRLKGFLKTAGGVIVGAVALVWLLQAIPARGTAGFGSVDPADSAFAAAARVLAHALSPAGFGDWRLASALVVGFLAKEAVISSWAQTFAAGGASGVSGGSSGGLTTAALHSQLHAAFTAASGGATGAAALAFLVFLLAYTPCVATLAALRQQIGLRWAAFGVGTQLTVAWTLAVAVFQIGRVLT
ncbi:MAG: ferrous iron transporter B [Actinomycetia bacterium]|nr:ferrous iron transporter B [Actinomycetes bacterium]